ncbi:MAG: hypothetical protein GEV11_03775 [Streptosporangiales bacterium]|nr:hypothetical protein [Streptosporangiales bacterium]
MTTSAVIVGLGTLAYGSTHTYLGFISDPPRHESAGTPPFPRPPTAPPSADVYRSASPAPERATREARDTARPAGPAPRDTPRMRTTATPEAKIPPRPPYATRTPRPVTFDYETHPGEGGDFTGSVTIHNVGEGPIEQWRLALAFSDARVSSVLDALGEPTLNGLIAGGLLGPPRIDPGESLTVTFTAEGDASGGVACRFNGDPCTLH